LDGGNKPEIGNPIQQRRGGQFTVFDPMSVIRAWIGSDGGLKRIHSGRDASVSNAVDGDL
jgi:hypothetical protein